MAKLACVFSFKESNWVSCQKIVFNLHRVYEQQKNGTLDNFNLSQKMELEEIRELAENIFQTRPDAIIFLDHRPHPIFLVAFLLLRYQGQPEPKFIFHLFGDFSLEYTKWGKVAEMLMGKNVQFIVPSPRQQLFFDRFLKRPQQSLICHFPVEGKDFYFQPELRFKQRQDWKVKDNERVFVFTGRLSRQKRIHTLIRAFALAFNHQSPSHLFLYGNPDSISDPFLGRHEVEGQYFRAIHKMYAKLPRLIRNHIHFMGSVSSTELIPVYQGADALVNLSVHNDEDFGMSVAESQCGGLPTILTSWGGLAAFHYPELEKASHFLSVRIGDASKLISLSKTVHALKTFQMFDQEERSKLSHLALNKFGMLAASRILEIMLHQETKPFKGFNHFFEKVSSKVMKDKHSFVTKKKKINTLYKDLYRVYA